MRSYEFIGHTADIRMLVEGETLAELFEAAFLGMAALLGGETCINSNEKECLISREIALSSANATTLLVDFLSEVLTASYEERAIFCEVEFLEITENAVKAKIRGKKILAFKEDIKAVTYHEAEVKQNAKGYWETMIIFDI